MWSAVSGFRPFLKFMGRRDLQEALGMANTWRPHDIVSVLGDDDEQAVIQACMGGKVSVRDAAITLLVLVTGLRACDLMALCLTDIDWRGSTVGIVQQKTGRACQVFCVSSSFFMAGSLEVIGPSGVSDG